ncbi:hypothetical protein [Clostridium brassicae]|uniref:DUF5659 domain-containing protein n=1 Tax=Clostridium brassicae TaxID=2999072 RepID=A0ABT4DAQ4_9CLOT|nr:hypothetical protein [Clostridium brassicae]MCY6958296.1 hypothetical protein [Clostridium brassicae]
MCNEYKYTIIDKRYLAESLAFLGYKYRKNGYGKDTKFVFAETEQFKQALYELLQLKKKVGKFIK